MKHTVQEMKCDLEALGLKSGDNVIMHSSYKSLGGIEGGESAVFLALFEVLGEQGTLILPAFSYDTVDYERPLFDLGETPSCVGWLTEYFRTSVPGVMRSMHATHSCCVRGKYAEELIRGHELDLTPVGKHSPIAKLPGIGGKILFLGCDPVHNTSLHGVEELVVPEYLFSERPIRYVLKGETGTVEQNAIRHGFRKNGFYYKQRYDRVIPLLPESDVSHGKVLDADCYLLSADAVWKYAEEKMREDPLYFVDKVKT